MLVGKEHMPPDVDVPEWQNIAAAHEALYSEIACS
jgi:hypothetical protein